MSKHDWARLVAAAAGGLFAGWMLAVIGFESAPVDPEHTEYREGSRGAATVELRLLAGQYQVGVGHLSDGDLADIVEILRDPELTPTDG